MLVLRVQGHTVVLQGQSAVPLLPDGADEQFVRLGYRWVDQGYTGGRDWIERNLGSMVDVVRHAPKARGEWDPLGANSGPRPFEWRRLLLERTGFRGVLRRRWVVEQTFSWLGQSPRLSQEYECPLEMGEALIYAAITRIMARRLTRW